VKQIRQRLTYANVMSSIAVFFVLGGATAFAATKIGANELKANSVLTGKIKKEAITTSKIKNSSITTGKIANGAVSATQLASGAVTSAQLADNSVSGAKLQNGSVTATKLAPGFVAPVASKLARFANIDEDGVVLAGSAGIAQANVTRDSTGFYCFRGLNPAPVGGIATIDYNEAGSEEVIQFGIGEGGNCDPGTQAFVDPRKAGAPENAGFFVILY
jgi:hypothetical protein